MLTFVLGESLANSFYWMLAFYEIEKYKYFVLIVYSLTFIVIADIFVLFFIILCFLSVPLYYATFFSFLLYFALIALIFEITIP